MALVGRVAMLNLAAGATTTAANPLTDAGTAVAPTHVVPDRSTPIVCVSATSALLTFRNDGSMTESANFDVRKDHSIQAPQTGLAPAQMLWAGLGLTSSAAMLREKDPVHVATTNTLTILDGNVPTYDGTAGTITSGNPAFGAFPAIDGVTLQPVAGQPQDILVRNEVASQWNGIYRITQNGDGLALPWVLTRRADANVSAEMGHGVLVPVEPGGTTLGGTFWICTVPAFGAAFTLGTTAMTFAKFMGTAVPGAATVGAVAAEGTSNLLARADHAHGFAALSSPAPVITCGTEQRSGYIACEAPIAEELITISADAGLAEGNSARVIALALPTVPVRLTIRITIDGAHAITAGTIRVRGTDVSGKAVDESVSAITAVSATVYTNAAMAIVANLDAVGIVATGGAGANSLSVGQSNRIGLPGSSTLANSGYAVHAAWVSAGPANSLAREAPGAVDAANGSIVPTTAPDGARHFAFLYTYSVTPTATQAVHTHTN